jgi:signal transduction histidine kinase
VHDAAIRGRPFVVLETTLDGTPYQVVARLLYQDPLRQNIETAFGFLVNLAWAKQHYFAGLLQQTLPGDNGRGSVAVSVYDEKGRAVADDGAHPGTSSAYVSKRAFPPLFFNPLLAAAEPSSGKRRTWTIQAAPRQDSSLIEAAGAANRMLILQILAAAMLAAGIILSLQAAYASQRLSELRSDFVASVTHEFKTPIATIRAAGETLAAGRIQDAAAQRDYARFIVGEGRRLTRLVDNLLAFSRVTESVEIRQPLEPVALGEIVTQTLERFSIQLTGDGFQVDASVPETLPLILGDPTALSLMLENIIDNAVRHSRKERRLTIRGTADGRSVQLAISDGGGGIPEDELEHVTKKFFRGRHAGHGGTGLGLAIASRIAATHGGTLRITNQADVGATVTISLPVAKGLDTIAAQQLAGAERRR